jgi:predicted XRE-type DNA-binding protein
MADDHIIALKRQLAQEILNVADQTRSWRAVRVFRIDKARLSDLRRGRVSRFSLERLIRMLATVGRRVDVTIVTVAPGPVRWIALVRHAGAQRSGAKPPRTRSA